MTLWPLFRRTKPAPETGAENARRFVAVVSRLAQENRYVVFYPHAGYHGTKRDEHGWIWMLNSEWRAHVLTLLRYAPVTDAAFHEPDSMEGWTFSARSTVPVPRIAQLTLEDSA